MWRPKFFFLLLFAQLVKNPPAMRKTWVQSLGLEDPLEKGKATHSSSPWDHKESDMTEWLTFTFILGLTTSLTLIFLVDIFFSLQSSHVLCNVFLFVFRRKLQTHLRFKGCAQLLQLCLTLCDPMNYSLPGSPVHGILQARVPEWVAVSFSNTNERSWNLIFPLVFILLDILSMFVLLSFLPLLKHDALLIQKWKKTDKY